jgi:stalled ribosome rescue protein Dom34
MHSERVEAHPQPEQGRRDRQRSYTELDEHFFGDVAGALANADDVLVVGPGATKLQFMRWMYQNAPSIECKVVSIESADHPNDAQFVAHVKRYFCTGEPRASECP